jgi:RHS repeat-associated protein
VPRNRSRCTCKERDPASGLDNFGARYYASTQARFTSPDPSDLLYADITNPQSLNLYQCVRNNPLTFTDPTGLALQINCTSVPDQTSSLGNPSSGYGGGVQVTGFPDRCNVFDDGTGNYTGFIKQQQRFQLHPFAPSNRTRNKITCGTVLPNGRTVGSYVNQLSNSINGSAGNPTSTPYGPGPNPSVPGPLTVANQVYSGTNFKIMFRGQGNAAFLGDAGNFAYSAVSGNIGVPLSVTEMVAGGYALLAGHSDANGPYFMDASATAQVPAGYGAGCQNF